MDCLVNLAQSIKLFEDQLENHSINADEAPELIHECYTGITTEHYNDFLNTLYCELMNFNGEVEELYTRVKFYAIEGDENISNPDYTCFENENLVHLQTKLEHFHERLFNAAQQIVELLKYEKENIKRDSIL
jgi:hypothetical protein